MRRRDLWLLACLVVIPLVSLSCGDDGEGEAEAVANARFAFEPVTPEDAGVTIRGTVGDVNGQRAVAGRVPVEFLLPGAVERVTGTFEADFGTRTVGNVWATLEFDGKIVSRQNMQVTGALVILEAVVPTVRHAEE